MPKPSMKRGPASPYASSNEVIQEIASGKHRAEDGHRVGCLISIRDTDDKLVIEIYRADKGVVVRAGGRDIDAEEKK